MPRVEQFKPKPPKTCSNCDWWHMAPAPAKGRRCMNPDADYFEALTTPSVSCPRWEQIGAGALRNLAL